MLTSRTILLAGFCSQLLCLGIARFAYTPLLALMQAEGLDPRWGGFLASINYAGYVTGALIAISLSNWRYKWRCYRFGLILAVISTFGMAVSHSLPALALWRFIAGLSAASSMLLASGLIMQHLRQRGLKPELGLHFAGLGLGIVLVAFCSELMSQYNLASSSQWLLFAALAFFLLVPAWLGLPVVEVAPGEKISVNAEPLPRAFYPLFLLMYFCAGYGYVVSITFLVAIASTSASLQQVGHWAFLLLGLAAAPSAIWWDQIARHLGYLPSLRVAAFINAIAIVLPVLVPGAAAFVISAMLFGASFIGCVSLVLTVAGRLMPEKPARLMAILTLCYGSAQIIAPSISALLASAAGNYESSLVVAALMMVIAVVLLSRLVAMFDAAHWLRRH